MSFCVIYRILNQKRSFHGRYQLVNRINRYLGRFWPFSLLYLAHSEPSPYYPRYWLHRPCAGYRGGNRQLL